MPLGEDVLVDDDGRLVPGLVLYEFPESGRQRALVRYETAGGVVVRRLFWRDELRTGPVLELGLRTIRPDNPQ